MSRAISDLRFGISDRGAYYSKETMTPPIRNEISNIHSFHNFRLQLHTLMNRAMKAES